MWKLCLTLTGAKAMSGQGVKQESWMSNKWNSVTSGTWSLTFRLYYPIAEVKEPRFMLVKPGVSTTF